jgi:exopolysaccharide biosynthesis protein
MKIKINKIRRFALILISLLCLAGLPILYYSGRPLPIPVRSQLFDGVVYYRRVKIKPRLLITHIITINLQTPGLKFLVTPGDTSADRPLKARTTSEFIKEFSVQIAVNGDGFTPWFSKGLFDYYPHPGDKITPNGTAISNGMMYHQDSAYPTLFFTSTNHVSFSAPADENAYNAISGDRMIVENGKAVNGLDNVFTAPRTAIGINDDGSKLVIVVADGRQFLYSQGATLAELAELLVFYGAEFAMNMDGGGSSTLAIRSGSGVKILNSPIDRNIPGFERAVGNHLGIFVP